MFSFDYRGADGMCAKAAETISNLSQSKGLLTLSARIGKVKALNFDAAKRGMCVLRKNCLKSVDALALGGDERLYFIEFKDRNFSTLSAQGRFPRETETHEKGVKRKKEKGEARKQGTQSVVPSNESTIGVELSEKLFDSVLLTGFGVERWGQVDFPRKLGMAKDWTASDVRKKAVFILVYNDASYYKDATSGELKFLSVGKKLSGNEGCEDPQIQGSRVYWGLEKFVTDEFCAEVHTLNVDEFEEYAVGRFKSL